MLRHSSEPAEGAVCEEKSQIWQEALVNLLDKSAILYTCRHGEAPDSSWSTVIPRGSWRRPFLRSARRNQSTRRLGVGWFLSDADMRMPAAVTSPSSRLFKKSCCRFVGIPIVGIGGSGARRLEFVVSGLKASLVLGKLIGNSGRAAITIIGISASPTACPLCGYGCAGTQHYRLSEAVILSTSTPIPAQRTFHRRCRDGADIEPRLKPSLFLRKLIRNHHEDLNQTEPPRNLSQSFGYILSWSGLIPKIAPSHGSDAAHDGERCSMIYSL